ASFPSWKATASRVECHRFCGSAICRRLCPAQLRRLHQSPGFLPFWRLTMATETQQSLQLPELKGCEHLHIQLHDGFIHLASMGNGQPVLLLPGWGQSWWEWREVMPALASAGYRALALDLRGGGWSRLPIAAISRTQRAQDLLELIDIMQLDSVTVVGHDLGAIAAYQVAFDRPQRIRRLAMLAVPPPQMKFDLALLPGLRHLWHQEAL